MSCAIAIAVMDAVDKGKMIENAKNVGEYLLSELNSMQRKFPDIIGDVRGVGLFVGIELIKDPKTKSPATEETREIVNRYIVIMMCYHPGLMVTLYRYQSCHLSKLVIRDKRFLSLNNWLFKTIETKSFNFAIK